MVMLVASFLKDIFAESGRRPYNESRAGVLPRRRA